MADGTQIEWTDATWNPITGCSIVSPGCTNCYAMKLAGTRLQHHPSRAGLTKPSKAGPVWTGETRLNEEWLLQPIRWNRPRKIFVCAHGDLFHESVPDEWIDRVFAVMALAPQHTFQILTKRASRMRNYINGPYTGDGVCARIAETSRSIPAIFSGSFIEYPIGPIMKNGEPEFGYRRFMRPQAWPLPNVWLGVSAERRNEWTCRTMHLRGTPAAARFVSVEPLLSDLGFLNLDGIDQVIVGGESGFDARPMHPEWVRSIRDQCARDAVPFLFKQWGEFASAKGFPGHMKIDHVFDDGYQMIRVGKKAAGRLLDGVLHDEYPEARNV